MVLLKFSQSMEKKPDTANRFSDRVAVIDVKPTSNREEISDYKRQRQKVSCILGLKGAKFFFTC